jgi:hypothetical protein
MLFDLLLHVINKCNYPDKILYMPAKLLALGDSWFHYPNALSRDGLPVDASAGVGNILHHLIPMCPASVNFQEKETTEIFDSITGNIIPPNDDAFGRCGEELMLMVYGYSRKDPGTTVYHTTWLDMLVDRINKYKDQFDTFLILLSAGGNDIADKNLPDFLNPYGNADPVKQDAINNAISVDLKGAYTILMTRICNQFPNNTFHFLTHGYACPPVDGRGLFDLDKNFFDKWLHKMTPGPWLKPYFEDPSVKIFRPQSDAIIGDFINRFNVMMSQLTCSSIKNNGTIHYIDLRGVPDPANIEGSWCNELHLDRNYFIKAATSYNNVISSLLAPKPAV